MPNTSSPTASVVTSAPTTSIRPGDPPARHGGLERPDPVPRQAHCIGQAGQEMPDAPVRAGCVHAQQHLAVAHRGPADLVEPQHVLGFAVVFLDDRPHRGPAVVVEVVMRALSASR